MGICDCICSSIDSLKPYTPDLTAATGWFRSPYVYGLAAVTKIDSVRINATQMLTQYTSDEETRSRLCLLATDLAKNAAVYGCQEGLKSFPGGTFLYKTVSRSTRGEKKLDNHEGEMKALQAKVAKLEEIVKKLEGLEREKHQPCADLKSNDYKKPEDVIRVFMMKEFMGTQLWDDWMVPGVRKTGKNPK